MGTVLCHVTILSFGWCQAFGSIANSQYLTKCKLKDLSTSPIGTQSCRFSYALSHSWDGPPAARHGWRYAVSVSQSTWHCLPSTTQIALADGSWALSSLPKSLFLSLPFPWKSLNGKSEAVRETGSRALWIKALQSPKLPWKRSKEFRKKLSVQKQAACSICADINKYHGKEALPSFS